MNCIRACTRPVGMGHRVVGRLVMTRLALSRRVVALALAGLWLSSPLAMAHKASDSFIYAAPGKLRIDIALQDMLRLQVMDLDGDGQLRWGELLAGEAEFANRLLAGISLIDARAPAGTGARCDLRAAIRGISEHSDGPYASWALQSPCLDSGRALRLEYDFLFARDPLHRALYNIQTAEGKTRVGVLSPGDAGVLLSGPTLTLWQTSSQFFVQGVIHLLTGYDHLAFLLVLLLPVINPRSGYASTAATARELALIVTAFTLSHSLTLVLATLGWIVLPSHWVEFAIALSISAAALLAFLPQPKLQRYLALGFGLIHGIGFAGVLADLLDQSAARTLALASFNVGVEVGQLAVVLVGLLLLLPLRNRRVFQRRVIPATLCLTAATGVYWAMLRI